jgi:hypothetical protein
MKYELSLSGCWVDFEADSAQLYFDGELITLDVNKGDETITFTLEPNVELYEHRDGKRRFITSDIKMEADMNDPDYGYINDDQMDELRLMGKLP